MNPKIQKVTIIVTSPIWMPIYAYQLDAAFNGEKPRKRDHLKYWATRPFNRKKK